MTEQMFALFDSASDSDVNSSALGVHVAYARAMPTRCTQDLLNAAQQTASSVFEDLPNAAPAERAQSAIVGVRRLLRALHTRVGCTASTDNPFSDISAHVEQRFAHQLPLLCSVIASMPGRFTDTPEVSYSELVSLCVLSELAQRLSVVYPFGVKVSILVEEGAAQQGVPGHTDRWHQLQTAIQRWCAVADRAQRVEVCAIDSYHGAKLQRVWRDLAAELTAGYFEGDSGVVAMLEEFLAAYGPYALREKEDVRRAVVVTKGELRDNELSFTVTHDRVRTGLSHLAHYQAREWLGIMDVTLPPAIWQISRELGVV